MCLYACAPQSNRRSGTVAVFTLVSAVVLIGFAALAVDVGHLYNVKAELQNAADAAALAGASAFTEDRLRTSAYSSFDLIGAARQRALRYAAENPANSGPVRLAPEDVLLGQFDWEHPDQALVQGGVFNSVQVTARCDEGSLNGPVINVFAGVLGFNTSDVSATAIAAFNDRISGYSPDGTPAILPFTILVDFFEDQVVNGNDDFEYDEQLDVVKDFSDGIPEINLYPYKYFDSGADGSGNFGALNIGVDNQGTSDFRDQLVNGVSPEQFEAEIGSRELTFAAADGQPTPCYISGNTGVSTGMEDAVATHAGKVVGFFLHTAVADPGSSAVFTIVSMRFGVLMEVDLTGNPESKRIVIQPVVYEDSAVKIDPDAPSTGGLVGRVMIVR